MFRGWPHRSARCPASGYYIDSAAVEACSFILLNTVHRLACSDESTHYGLEFILMPIQENVYHTCPVRGTASARIGNLALVRDRSTSK